MAVVGIRLFTFGRTVCPGLLAAETAVVIFAVVTVVGIRHFTL